ncbi:MAG TPA: DNA alkylation repair protein [Croceibacterium sp.]|nr:DNA alkylation repair protein [Croceibacterium sp.]
MPAAPPPLLPMLRERLRQVADPARAPGMQAYMKSAMPYLGVSAVPLRKICRELFAGLEWSNARSWRIDVLSLWRGAEFREERYAAIELSGVRAALPYHTLSSLPMYEEMVVTGAWWDYVDAIATQRLWTMAEYVGPAMDLAMLAWSSDADMWKRRAAILHQIKAGARTDPELLFRCIEPSLGSKEFFLNKAIGWALRQYARTDPDEVRHYVARNAASLSPLSRREALKHIGGAA